LQYRFRKVLNTSRGLETNILPSDRADREANDQEIIFLILSALVCNSFFFYENDSITMPRSSEASSDAISMMGF
jgi:hypothetical protein